MLDAKEGTVGLWQGSGEAEIELEACVERRGGREAGPGSDARGKIGGRQLKKKSRGPHFSYAASNFLKISTRAARFHHRGRSPWFFFF